MKKGPAVPRPVTFQGEKGTAVPRPVTFQGGSAQLGGEYVDDIAHQREQVITRLAREKEAQKKAQKEKAQAQAAEIKRKEQEAQKAKLEKARKMAALNREREAEQSRRIQEEARHHWTQQVQNHVAQGGVRKRKEQESQHQQDPRQAAQACAVQWTCTVCTLINDWSSDSCGACTVPRLEDQLPNHILANEERAQSPSSPTPSAPPLDASYYESLPQRQPLPSSLSNPRAPSSHASTSRPCENVPQLQPQQQQSSPSPPRHHPQPASSLPSPNRPAAFPLASGGLSPVHKSHPPAAATASGGGRSGWGSPSPTTTTNGDARTPNNSSNSDARTPNSSSNGEDAGSGGELRRLLTSLLVFVPLDSEQARCAFRTLSTLVANVHRHPEQRKYWSVRLHNPAIRSMVTHAQGILLQFLAYLGFEPTDNGCLELTPSFPVQAFEYASVLLTEHAQRRDVTVEDLMIFCGVPRRLTAMIEQGYDDVTVLRQMTQQEMEAMMDHCAFLPGERVRFVQRWRQVQQQRWNDDIPLRSPLDTNAIAPTVSDAVRIRHEQDAEYMASLALDQLKTSESSEPDSEECSIEQIRLRALEAAERRLQGNGSEDR